MRQADEVSEARRPLGELRRRRDVARVAMRQPSARIVGAAMMVALAARVRAGRVRSGDLAAAAAVLAVRPAAEWALHRSVLHARAPWLAGAHPAHHADPTRLDRVVLRPGAAVLDALGVGIVARGAARAAGAGIGPAWTAVAVAEASLAAYEWCHLLIHSGYRPRSRWFRGIRGAHRRHHGPTGAGRDFGVTSRSVDRLVGVVSRWSVPTRPAATAGRRAQRRPGPGRRRTRR
jgi:sterol desaturase/sphingolipid hydroxylase (fatty acid hydroxylase superfamily)